MPTFRFLFVKALPVWSFLQCHPHKHLANACPIWTPDLGSRNHFPTACPRHVVTSAAPRALRIQKQASFKSECFPFSVVLFVEALSARSDHCRAGGCRIRGMTVVMGEMEVARANPKTPATRDASLQPAAVAYCPAGSPRPPLSRWTTSTRPGAHRALGDGGWHMEKTNGRVGSIVFSVKEAEYRHVRVWKCQYFHSFHFR